MGGVNGTLHRGKDQQELTFVSCSQLNVSWSASKAWARLVSDNTPKQLSLVGLREVADATVIDTSLQVEGLYLQEEVKR